MTQSNFIRLSGWAMVVAAICLLLTFYPWPFAFLFANLLITVGLLGLRARYGEQAGNTAKIALGIGVLGGVAGVVTSLLLAIGYENVRILKNYSMVVMFLGLFVFGLVALRTKPMPPHSNGLPVLVGFWWPFIVIGANVYYQVVGHWQQVPNWMSFTLFCIMGISLAWLGYVLQADAPPEKALA